MDFMDPLDSMDLMDYMVFHEFQRPHTHRFGPNIDCQTWLVSQHAWPNNWPEAWPDWSTNCLAGWQSMGSVREQSDVGKTTVLDKKTVFEQFDRRKTDFR